MAYFEAQLNNVETYRILTKPGGLTYKDICALIGCGKSTAQKIIYNIHKKIILTQGSLKPVKGRITRQAFCNYMNWDFDEIQSFAFAEISYFNSC